MVFFKEPTKISFNKKQKGRLGNCVARGTELEYGQYGLRVLEDGKIGVKQLEAIRLVLVRTLQKQGKIRWRIQLNYPRTKKSVGVRMGKGKGSFEEWMVLIRKNRILVELEVSNGKLALLALNRVRYKISLPVQIVRKDV